MAYVQIYFVHFRVADRFRINLFSYGYTGNCKVTDGSKIVALIFNMGIDTEVPKCQTTEINKK